MRVLPGLYNIDFVMFASVLGATPDGRNAGDPICCHYSLTPSCATKGVTAALLSASKADLKRGVAASPVYVTIPRLLDTDLVPVIRSLTEEIEKLELPIVNLTVAEAEELRGAVAWEVLEFLLPCVDLFLYDIKAVSPELHLLGTGMDNAVILENYRRLIKAGAAVEVRLPIIPSFNDSEEEQALIDAFLREQEPPVAIRRIPFHTPGEGKYAQLGQIISNGSYIVRS